ncbi:MAG: CDP-glycerol glycerophosphotransferase family protein, partial [Marinomonas sp.]
FPFDLEDYLKCRHLYVEYDKFAFGDVVTSVDDLVNNIVHSKWADNSRYQETIEEHYKKMFSYSKTSYSERSYQAICNLLSGVPPEDII